MKRAMILMAVMALMVALMTGSALAKGNDKRNSGGKGPALVAYNLKGTVEAVAEAGTSITVGVIGGNKAGRQHLGFRAFSVTPLTLINVNDREGTALEQIREGYSVVVQSKFAKDATSFDARVISAEAPVPSV